MRHEGVDRHRRRRRRGPYRRRRLGDGGTAPFHHDDTIFITHGAERCESRQVFKKVLKNGATGVFQGKILVKPGAQKTDGYQISQALLLDEASQFLAKPELEIYADDVKCSHGSTTGAIDENALFYLRSRGVPRRTGQVLLVLSFLAEAMAEIEDQRLAEEMRGRLGGMAGAAPALSAMARRSLVDAIWLAWRHPRRAMAAEIAAGLSERAGAPSPDAGLRALLRREPAERGARGEGAAAEDPVGAAVAAHLYGYVALAPLLAYGLAAVVHSSRAASGARRGFLAARAALFWSALAGGAARARGGAGRYCGRGCG